jgi:hypothetical protein
MLEHAPTSHNRSVYASPPTAARAPKNRSRAAPFVRFFSATFWPAAMLCIALWAGQNVENSRNVMRHFFEKFGNIIKNSIYKLNEYGDDKYRR